MIGSGLLCHALAMVASRAQAARAVAAALQRLRRLRVWWQGHMPWRQAPRGFAGERVPRSARAQPLWIVDVTAAEEIPIALEPFRQIDGAPNRRYEGTGLGLPLARTLVELHGGSLAIDSAPGEGTTVTVTLPADRIVRRAA